MGIKSTILTWFGDMRFYKIPPIVVYAPTTFDVKGKHTREIINLIQPGDIILRKYNNYLDGCFIPGEYSHTGIYVGDNNMIHSIAEGVCEQDIIDYLRCDRCIVLRPNKGQELAIQRVKEWLKTPYDFDFTSGNKALYCHELGADAYKELDIEKKTPTLFYGWIKGTKVYLAESFLTNSNFTTIYKFVP